MTKKVVINNCFGGFSLSIKAMEELAKLKGDGDLTHYKLNLEDRVFEKLTLDQLENDYLFVHTVTKDLGDAVSEDEFFKAHDKYGYYFSEIDRHDHDLVKVIEKLGLYANSRFSELKVVEIPKEVDYQIEEYDGVEWIAEKHRTWS